MQRSWGGQKHGMLERRKEGQCGCSPRVRGSVGWDEAREVGKSKTMVGHGEESDFALGMMAPGKGAGG